MTELYVATGDGVAHITQHGETWTVETQLKDSEVQCLVLDPHHPGTIYAGSQGKGVLKSSDGGIHWQDTHLPQQDVFSLAVSPVNGAVYAGCEPSMLFRSENGGQSWQELSALRSIPSAPTWSFPPRPWTSHVRWIAPNPHDAALLIVGIELGGLMYSSDGGQTWADHRPGAQRDVHALACIHMCQAVPMRQAGVVPPGVRMVAGPGDPPMQAATDIIHGAWRSTRVMPIAGIP